jgi:hypothetical protein
MSPSPPFRGEREGPNPHGSARRAARGQAPGWEGEVGGVADRRLGPPHPTLSPRPAGEGEFWW